jgi:hypothetical protein
MVDLGHDCYPMIRAVVRQRRAIPLVSAFLVAAIILWGLQSTSGFLLALPLATLCWVVVRLGVEVIELIADTLLPR